MRSHIAFYLKKANITAQKRVELMKIDDLDESKYKIINGDSSKEIKKIW